MISLLTSSFYTRQVSLKWFSPLNPYGKILYFEVLRRRVGPASSLASSTFFAILEQILAEAPRGKRSARMPRPLQIPFLRPHRTTGRSEYHGKRENSSSVELSLLNDDYRSRMHGYKYVHLNNTNDLRTTSATVNPDSEVSSLLSAFSGAASSFDRRTDDKDFATIGRKDNDGERIRKTSEWLSFSNQPYRKISNRKRREAEDVQLIARVEYQPDSNEYEYIDDTLSPFTRYEYSIRAVNSQGSTQSRWRTVFTKQVH